MLPGCEGFSKSGEKGALPRANDTVRVQPDLSTTSPEFKIAPLFPPGGAERPAEQGQTGRARTADGLPILEPMGLKAEALFAEKIKDPDQRMDRLENAVQEIRGDLDAALPAINRLIAIEGDIQQLVGQLQTLLSQEPGDATTPIIEPMPVAQQPDMLINDLRQNQISEPESLSPVAPIPPPPPAPSEQVPIKLPKLEPIIEGPPAEPITKPKVTSAPPTSVAITPLTVPQVATVTSSIPAKSAPITASSVRIGSHDDKIRLVIESDAPINVHNDLDLTERLLVLDITGAALQNGQATMAANPLVRSITLSNGGAGGGQLVAELQKDTKVLRTSVLPPGANNSKYRTIIDLLK